MDTRTARETLHGWIEEANDAFILSLVELFRTAIKQQARPQTDPQPGRKAITFTVKIDDMPVLPSIITMMVGDSPQTAEERRQDADRLARAGNLERFIKVRYVNGEGQETDRYGNILPSEEA
jgi:hypothetical protein